VFDFENPLLDQTEDYTLLDATLAWTSESEAVRLQLTGRNLTDEEYKVGGYQFLGPLYGNVVNSFYGPPRTYTLTVGYSFR
jgi:iron complex outermembrane receptor protein